jgi:hypothetical protein
VEGRAGQKLELAEGLRAERTPRELRLSIVAAGEAKGLAIPEYQVRIPGEVTAEAFGVRLRIEMADASVTAEGRVATLRNWKPGDRVWLRHSSGPRKATEILERLHVTGSGRRVWPVLELDGRIAWMRGVEVEPEAGIRIEANGLEGIGN